MSTLDELFGALKGVPRLEGARCVGRSELFDEVDDPESVEYAVHICRGCPALAACEDWFNGLRPAARPFGVIAGRPRRPRKPRPVKPRPKPAAVPA